MISCAAKSGDSGKSREWGSEKGVFLEVFGGLDREKWGFWGKELPKVGKRT